MNYERKVNAIFSYHFVHLVKEYGFNNIIMDSKNRLENTLNEDNTNKKYKIFDSKLEVTRKQIRYYIYKLDELERLYTNGEKGSLFLVLDNLSFGDLLSLFNSLPPNFRNKVFYDLKKYNLNLGVTGINQFSHKLFNIISIRNCVAHNNSIEMLCLYYNKNKSARRGWEVQKQRDLIEYIKNM